MSYRPPPRAYRRHPDLEFDRFYSADPYLPFGHHPYRYYDYDDMDYTSSMVEDRM